MLLCVPYASAYEVAVGLGSTADQSATIAMGDRSKWPYVADHSWGPLANLVPIAFLSRQQQEAVFNNFKQRRAITELPFPSIRFESSQPDIDFIESFGLSVPYVFVLYEYHERVQHQGQQTADALKAQGVIDSMLTRDEILQLKSRFSNKKIIMNTRSWVRNSAHLQTVADVLDGVCIEYIPNNTPGNIALHVAPFAEWAHNNDKILMFLMPPLPDDHLEDRFVRVVTRMAQTIYDENINRLPKGWMNNENLIFVPANYTFGESNLDYVPEDAESSVLAAAKALLLMRPELDAGPVQPTQKNNLIAPLLLLLE
ncbi:MAG: hypothetical protein OER96_02155 [Gammaproteobacteria bacterium]|nr:hypothetical protein [Gammaproteobacteria bacterium]